MPKIDTILRPDCTVTAIAWHPLGHTVAYAMDSTRTLFDGREETEQVMVISGPTHGPTDLKHGFEFLLPPPLVICMRFSPDGEYLLVVRTNAKRGLLQVWRTGQTDRKEHGPLRMRPNEPVAWRSTEHTMLDACWTANNSFVVCGNDGLANAYQIDATEITDWAAGGAGDQGLIELRSAMTRSGRVRWDRICHDRVLDAVVFASTEHNELALVRVPREKDEHAASSPITYVPIGRLADLAFQPHSSIETPAALGTSDNIEQSCLLAVALEIGLLMIYQVTRPASNDAPLEYVQLASLCLPEATAALALAWSPDGAHLAVAGPDVVHIWRKEALEVSEEEGKDREEHLVTWHHDRAAYGKLQQKREDLEDLAVKEEEIVVERLSLSWSADGESLCFGLGDGVSFFPYCTPALKFTDIVLPARGHQVPALAI